MKRNKKYLTALVLLSLYAGSAAFASDLPTYFDWRLNNPTNQNSDLSEKIVGPIFDQGPLQTGWAFATLASLESTLNVQLQAADSTHLGPIAPLSERYLAWLTYAQPLNGGGDGYVLFPTDLGNYPTTNDEVYNAGGKSYSPVSVLVRYGTTFEYSYPYTAKDMEGVSLIANRGTALHDVYNLGLSDATNDHSATAITRYKTLLKEFGLLAIAYDSLNNESTQNSTDIYHSKSNAANHMATLVGWDDTYKITDSDGTVHTGAWIMRNSRGTGTSDYPVGNNGYFYISYDDATIVQPVIYQAETDWGRYTSVNTIAPGGMNGYCQGNDAYYTATSSYKTADKLTSGANQMLKAVGIYVPADSMSYKVEVSLKGTTPADTTTIYIKSGTFGQDGTALYKGYRTIDFDKFVYLPNTQNYIITVTLTGTDGTTYVVPLSGAAQKDTYTTVAAGTSFIYDAATGIWVDTKNTTGKDGYTNLAIPMYALGKYSNEANGGDFTVVSLNDNGAGGSEIYLGKKEELYTTDLLHPALMADGVATSVSARHTLSNMTVELTKGLTDSVYGGVISGDGSVTKTGDGILALSGANTYTGDTNVNVGSLALTGSLQSPVIVANGATFTGYGTISGNLTNSGTLQPGLTAEVRNLFTAASGGSSTTTVPQVGTLTVNGNLTSTGKLVIATINKNVSKLEVRGISTLTGTTLSVVNGGTNPLVNLKYNYLTSQGGITGNVTATDVSPYITLSATTDGNNAYFTAIQNQTLGGLANMTTSEISVGSALNKKILEVGQADSDSTTTATLNSLLYQNATASKATMASITAEARAQLLTVSPLTAMTIGAAYDRLDTMDLNGNALVPTTANSFDGVPATMKVDIPMALDADNELWFKLFRGYEMYGGNSNSPDLNNKSFGGAIGYDRAIPGTTTRVGGLFAYGHTDYAAGTLNGDSHDWRIGTYASHDDGTWKTQGLIAYGRNHYDINRTIANYGDRLNANYKANVFDASAKVKYLPQQNRLKSVQVAPYASLSYTHTSQDGYSETGGSAFAQSLDSASNNSLRGEVGLEFTHNINMTSSVGGSIGYKRVLSGVNPELNGTFTGDNNRFHITTDNDRNYITYNLNVRKNTGNNWTIQGELRGEKSAHNHSEVYSALAKYAF